MMLGVSGKCVITDYSVEVQKDHGHMLDRLAIAIPLAARLGIRANLE